MPPYASLQDYIRAYENRGLAHVKVKQYMEAIADYTVAIELGPTQWEYEQRAQAKAAMGDQHGAAEDGRQAAELKQPARPAGVIGATNVPVPGSTAPVPPSASHP